MTDPFEQLKAKYLASFDAKYSDIKKALDDENHSALLYLVHQLGGSAGSYGFETVSEACLSLESQLTKQPATINNMTKQSAQQLLKLIHQAKA